MSQLRTFTLTVLYPVGDAFEDIELDKFAGQLLAALPDTHFGAVSDREPTTAERERYQDHYDVMREASDFRLPCIDFTANP